MAEGFHFGLSGTRLGHTVGSGTSQVQPRVSWFHAWVVYDTPMRVIDASSLNIRRKDCAAKSEVQVLDRQFERLGQFIIVEAV